MKVVFLLDNNEYIELAPDKIQIRQLQPNLAALGTEVTVPVLEEDGKTPQTNEDGTPKTQVIFRMLVQYNVNLKVPAASLEEEIANLKKELGEKLAEQVVASVAPAPAAEATSSSTEN
jgi:hypothetical protein